MVVDQRGEQVVGLADRVHVAHEVQVDVLRGDDLGVTGARASALDPEVRAERRLAQAERRRASGLPERVAEADAGGRLAFTRRSRGHRGHQDERSVVGIRSRFELRHGNLRDVVSVRQNHRRVELQLPRDFLDRPLLVGRFDLEIRECHHLLPPVQNLACSIDGSRCATSPSGSGRAGGPQLGTSSQRMSAANSAFSFRISR